MPSSLRKNRLQWLKDGDRNSAFFHRLHRTQRSKASITTVQVDDNFNTVDEEIGNQVVSYYQRLFSKDDTLENDYSILQSFSWATISDSQNDMITTISTEEKIKLAVSTLTPTAHLARTVSMDDSTINAGILFRRTLIMLSFIFFLLS